MTKKPRHDVSAIIDGILTEGIRRGASDIHFEPGAGRMEVRFRLDGALRTVEHLPGEISENVISRLKVMANLLTYRNDIPQEGRIEGDYEAKTGDQAARVLDKRLSVFPTIHGQRAVVRLFFDNEALTDLANLGLPDEIREALEQYAARTQGILLLTGPAGSGKSTTLGALLRHISRAGRGRSIVALEDPVERDIPGVTQVQIDPHGDLTFPLALRSLLRQDPEVLMVGEVRDAQTARIVIEAGLTGHLLMTTMHSGSCSGALLRLLEMGIEPYQVTSSVHGVLNQRLVRRLCEACRTPSGEGYAAQGCQACMNTGYRGRVLLAEWVRVNEKLRKAILTRADLETLDAILREQGHRRLSENARRLVSDGITSVEEIARVTGDQEYL